MDEDEQRLRHAGAEAAGRLSDLAAALAGGLWEAPDGEDPPAAEEFAASAADTLRTAAPALAKVRPAQAAHVVRAVGLWAGAHYADGAPRLDVLGELAALHGELERLREELSGPGRPGPGERHYGAPLSEASELEHLVTVLGSSGALTAGAKYAAAVARTLIRQRGETRREELRQAGETERARLAAGATPPPPDRTDAP